MNLLEGNPRLKKLVIVLVIGACASAAWNIYYFYVVRAVDPEKQKQQYAREMDADPLFSDNANYPSLFETSGDKGGSHQKQNPKEKKYAGQISPGTEQLVRPHIRKKFLAELEDADRSKKKTELVLNQEGLSGEIHVFETDQGVEKVFFRVEIDAPKELDVDEMIAGKKRIWLRAVESELRHPIIQEDKPGEQIHFKGKAKAYVQHSTDRVRTVVDIFTWLSRLATGQWVVAYRVSRGERNEHRYPFVEKIGEDFSVYIDGSTSELKPETPPEAENEQSDDEKSGSAATVELLK